jgi:hypothetical protein
MQTDLAEVHAVEPKLHAVERLQSAIVQHEAMWKDYNPTSQAAQFVEFSGVDLYVQVFRPNK